jgi:hypothetical protein
LSRLSWEFDLRPGNKRQILRHGFLLVKDLAQDVQPQRQLTVPLGMRRNRLSASSSTVPV